MNSDFVPKGVKIEYCIPEQIAVKLGVNIEWCIFLNKLL